MTEPLIYLSLTDDWELRGNGAGDIEAIQFRPMRELVRIYNRHGVRSTFNAEVMQQLTFRKFEREFPELRALADRWDEHVTESYRQGHDVQLHLHPQWTKAEYNEGRWKLAGDWSILNYDEETAFQLLSAGKEYLENLLRPVNPNYRVVSFRAGSSIIAPSPFILSTLARLGIKLDMSIVGGMYHDTRNVQIDYRETEEDFLPFYPQMTDARRVSDREEEIICVPIHHFYGSRQQFIKTLAAFAKGRAGRLLSSSKANGQSTENYAEEEWMEKRHASRLLRIYEKGIRPGLKGWYLTADLSRMNLALMREMLRSIRRRARQSGLKALPVIISNHSKDIKDLRLIDRFISEIAKAEDIRFLIQTELVEKLEQGEFPIRKAGQYRLR
ncbi:MAG: hypothetical protein ICV60_12655 [Pyrinomonadaceae bacterium]|nr:hypothetical protein [Pyrinomonadaceae bacterium]